MFEKTPSDQTYNVVSYWAGMQLYSDTVLKSSLGKYLKNLKKQLKKGTVVARSCGSDFVVRELCYDVYSGIGYRADLSRSLKI